MKFVYKKYIHFLLFTFLFLAAANLHAQNIGKHFYVINYDSKIPVEDATVFSEDLSFNEITDENGIIKLDKLPGSVKKLFIMRIGYEGRRIDVDSMNTTGNPGIIYLKYKISSLTEVSLTAFTNTGIFKTISDLDIHLRPINNSQEVLRMVPGLFIGQHAGGGKSEQIFLRGFDIDHGTDINLSVDGMPVNMVSHAHGQGYADLHWVIPELIEKINFNKGPYYADKGNFTTAGFVEFKTKDYLENSFLKSEVGQFNTFRGVAGINLLSTKTDRRIQSLFFAGETSFTKGFFESPQNFKRFNGMLKYHGIVNRKNTLTASLTGFTSKWNASGQIPERAVKDGSIGFYGAIDNTEGGETSRYNANIELNTSLSKGTIIRNQFFYTKNKFKLYSNFTFFKEDPVNGDQILQRENRNIIGYNGSYQRDYFIQNMKSQSKLGLQLRHDVVKDIELTRTKNREIVTENIKLGDIKELNAGAYWIQKISVSKNLDITGGLRTDFFNNQYDDRLEFRVFKSNSVTVSPKINFNLRVNNNLQLYFYNGKGFHSNDTRVAVQQSGKKVLPPGWGSDIGGIFKLGKNLLVQSAVWYLWLDQEFIYVGDEGIVEAGGQTRRVGIDISTRYEVVKNLFADVDLSFANPRALDVVKSESYLPLSPRLSSVGGFTYRKEYGWNGSLRYRYMDDRPANEDNSVVAKGYFVTDAAIHYTKKRWEAGLAIQNVFNIKWKETQFDTESKLQNEPEPVSEIHFTPGTPFYAKVNFTVFF